MTDSPNSQIQKGEGSSKCMPISELSSQSIASPAGGPGILPQADPFKDTILRYLGYANEVGEAFRAFVHVNAVRATYAVASLYVAGHAAHKGSAASVQFDGSPSKTRVVTEGVMDTLIWQSLASVVIPGFTINRLCWASRLVTSKYMTLPASKSLSTAVGLTAIPFIIHPIDRKVDDFMNWSIRKYFTSKHHFPQSPSNDP